MDYGMNLHLVSNVLFVFIAIFVVMKIIFRPEDIVYLTSPLDYLFLAMIVALIAVPGEVVLAHKIPSSI